VRHLVGAAVVLAFATVGCADDASTVNDQAAAETVVAAEPVSTATLDTTTSDTTTSDTAAAAAAGDFGSRYVGSPVAFWFWAPY